MNAHLPEGQVYLPWPVRAPLTHVPSYLRPSAHQKVPRPSTRPSRHCPSYTVPSGHSHRPVPVRTPSTNSPSYFRPSAHLRERERRESVLAYLARGEESASPLIWEQGTYR
jgi:hypothetical protein